MIDIDFVDILRFRTEVSKNLESIIDIVMFPKTIDKNYGFTKTTDEIEFDLSDSSKTDFF